MTSSSEDPQKKISGLAKETGDDRQEQPLSKIRPLFLIIGVGIIVVIAVVILIITIGKA